MPFGTEKPEWAGYPKVKKIDDVYSRFDRIPACDRRTDILSQHSRAMHTRRAVKISRFFMKFGIQEQI